MGSLDIVIKDGYVVDGTGNPWFRSDVGVDGDIIVRMGHIESSKAERVIDAQGLAVAPGFIDPHTHADHTLLTNGRAESYLHQGVTTLVVGNCGFSMAPATAAYKEDLKRYVEPFVLGELSWNWDSFAEFLAELEGVGLSPNVASLVGHGTVRLAVMGFQNRPPSRGEMREMKALVATSMAEGAFGLSSGLGYPPGVFSRTEELIELCGVLRPYNGLYVTHMRQIRGRPPTYQEALAPLEEAIEIGERAGVPIHILHVASSMAGARVLWGRQREEVLARIDAARARGLDVTADMYPYVAGASYLASVLPRWIHERGTSGLLEALAQPETRQRLRGQLELEWDRYYFSYSPRRKNRAVEGESIQEIAMARQTHPVDALCDLLLDEEGGGTYVSFWGREEDVRTLMRHPAVMIGSDGWSLAPYGPLGVGKPHPRCYGTYPRVLGRYVRVEGVMTLEEAVGKMASLPAQRFGLWDRGLLRERMRADITVFDPHQIIDRATYEEPHQYPEGVSWVLVNGEVVIEGGEHTGALPGRVLRRGS
ncbi:MAG: amidohydrolase family protein [Candidatus Bathyarchaeia archaeon]